MATEWTASGIAADQYFGTKYQMAALAANAHQAATESTVYTIGLPLGNSSFLVPGIRFEYCRNFLQMSGAGHSAHRESTRCSVQGQNALRRCYNIYRLSSFKMAGECETITTGIPNSSTPTNAKAHTLEPCA